MAQPDRASYDLYGDTQLHAGEVPLDRYRVLVLSTHPEYWSREMYKRVKRWVVEEAGRLAYRAGRIPRRLYADPSTTFEGLPDL